MIIPILIMMVFIRMRILLIITNDAQRKPLSVDSSAGPRNVENVCA